MYETPALALTIKLVLLFHVKQCRVSFEDQSTLEVNLTNVLYGGEGSSELWTALQTRYLTNLERL